MRIIRLGSGGPDVEQIQSLLNAYFARTVLTAVEIQRATKIEPRTIELEADNFVVKVDGDFGRKTKAAVLCLQAHENLGLDGDVGPMTRAELEQRALSPLEAEDPAKDGLLINGRIVPISGVHVVGPHDTAWSHLTPGDCRKRRPNPYTNIVEVMQWVLHKTVADDPESLLPGRGPAGGARRTAEFWAGDPKHSGAHLVSGDDGELGCLADLFLDEAFHDGHNVSNTLAVGIETRELGPRNGKPGGGFYEAAAETTVRATLVGCAELGVQLQTPRAGAYHNAPMPRFKDGGSTLVGIFGHRDVSDRRGKWDPGELLLDMLRARGVESFDFNAGQDFDVWKERQRELVRLGHKLDVTGVPKASTRAALLLEGYTQGIYALGRPNFRA